MAANTIEPLDWDSQFFGYPIAKISLDQSGIKNMVPLFKQLEFEKYRLTYFFVPPAEMEINEHVKKMGGVLVDQKTVFRKPTEKHSAYSNRIIELHIGEMNENILRLALQAGKYSRFRIDKNFKNKEYERLYTEWIAKSVTNEISFKTLAALTGADIVGITTLADEKNYAHIGLVAVDETCRGQGVGSDLIHTADTIAFDMGFEEIKVVTQLQNRGACKLYEKCCFRIESITNVYHYWQ